MTRNRRDSIVQTWEEETSSKGMIDSGFILRSETSHGYVKMLSHGGKWPGMVT